MSNTCDFVLDESIYDETSDHLDSEIDYVDKNIPMNLMNQKYNFIHIT